MWLSKLSLENFRNYSYLTLEPPKGLNVLWGDNAQGKTNLLEAIYLLAISKSPRSSADKELLRWEALQDETCFLRVQGVVHKAKDELSVEVVIQSLPIQAVSPPADDKTPEERNFQKRLKVNGLPRRASDFVGRFNSVLFSCQDIDLVYGSPSLRRHYLDITLSQLDNTYLREIQRYNQVLVQRNHLLRLLQGGSATKAEMSFWNQALVASGSYIILQRLEFIETLNKLAPPIHLGITGEKTELKLHYLQNVGDSEPRSRESLENAFRKTLAQLESREIERGVSLAGPHRDDIQFFLAHVDIGVYGSRGQHRTIALALKLAEAQLFHQRTGEHPVILLDDVLSELDARRRAYLLEAISDNEQVFLTTTDLDRLSPGILAKATVYRVTEGKLSPPVST